MTTFTDTIQEACDCPSCSDGPGALQSLQADPTPCRVPENSPAARTGVLAGCGGGTAKAEGEYVVLGQCLDTVAPGAVDGFASGFGTKAPATDYSALGLLLARYPGGIMPVSFHDALAIARRVDKLFLGIGQACDACERADCDPEACPDFPGGPESGEVP